MRHRNQSEKHKLLKNKQNTKNYCETEISQLEKKKLKSKKKSHKKNFKFRFFKSAAEAQSVVLTNNSDFCDNPMCKCQNKRKFRPVGIEVGNPNRYSHNAKNELRKFAIFFFMFFFLLFSIFCKNKNK